MSGPGKQLFNLIHYANDSEFRWIICSPREKEPWDFRAEAEKIGIPFEPLKETIKYDPYLIWQACQLVKKNNIQVVESHGYKASTIAFFLKRLTGIPWVSMVHGWTSEDVKIKIYNKLDQWLLRFPDKIITVSDALRKKVISMGIAEDKAQTIHNVFDPDLYNISDLDVRQAYGIQENVPVIGVIGRLSSEKGQEVFIKAFKDVLKGLPEARALIIGEGPDGARLKHYANMLGLNSQLIFTGHRVDVLSFYKAIDLLVIPSLSEGLPNVLLEALFFEVPVIATRVGGIPEIISHNVDGVLMPAGEPGIMAKEVIMLIKDKEKMKEISRRGKAVLKKFSPQNRAEKFVNMYRALLAEKDNRG
jgi:glycosyltransferase involved in cell wall biosynthesis